MHFMYTNFIFIIIMKLVLSLFLFYITVILFYFLIDWLIFFKYYLVFVAIRFYCKALWEAFLV